MKVAVEEASSSEVPVASGVSHGIVLGPLLFLCHMNDLPDAVKTQVRLFADDCLLYRVIRTCTSGNVCTYHTWCAYVFPYVCYSLCGSDEFHVVIPFLKDDSYFNCRDINANFFSTRAVAECFIEQNCSHDKTHSPISFKLLVNGRSLIHKIVEDRSLLTVLMHNEHIHHADPMRTYRNVY